MTVYRVQSLGTTRDMSKIRFVREEGSLEVKQSQCHAQAQAFFLPKLFPQPINPLLTRSVYRVPLFSWLNAFVSTASEGQGRVMIFRRTRFYMVLLTRIQRSYPLRAPARRCYSYFQFALTELKKSASIPRFVDFEIPQCQNPIYTVLNLMENIVRSTRNHHRSSFIPGHDLPAQFRFP